MQNIKHSSKFHFLPMFLCFAYTLEKIDFAPPPPPPSYDPYRNIYNILSLLFPRWLIKCQIILLTQSKRIIKLQKRRTKRRMGQRTWVLKKIERKTQSYVMFLVVHTVNGHSFTAMESKVKGGGGGEDIMLKCVMCSRQFICSFPYR